MARKLGKIMADLRNTTNEFKETWEREVNFDEEARALKIDDDIAEKTEPRSASPGGISAPAIKQIDASPFEGTVESTESQPVAGTKDEANEQDMSLSEKSNWL